MQRCLELRCLPVLLLLTWMPPELHPQSSSLEPLLKALLDLLALSPALLSMSML